jgi:hypothetical protein
LKSFIDQSNSSLEYCANSVHRSNVSGAEKFRPKLPRQLEARGLLVCHPFRELVAARRSMPVEHFSQCATGSLGLGVSLPWRSSLTIFAA